MSTKEEVFLFDVLSLGSECFQRGLQEIMESGKILKVMHDCRQPSDLLYHQFGVELVNVFDTQVAAVIIYRMEHNGDYPRYVESQYSLLLTELNMPLTELQIIRYRETHQKEDQEVWCQRPAPLHILTAAAKQVKHLLPLRMKLMEKLLKEVTVGTEIYLGYVRDASNEDSKRGPTMRHLLPHAFKHLTTYMDFLRHRYMRAQTVPCNRSTEGPTWVSREL
ncbi:piRNA biogenesis protein EXD1-like [Haliotis rubra]|uniref:piRNA biogenesis protein EXD1-like n=1 Tax=Haliotis rubra TaxID=36100 RepID=UPI001EE5116D|nr:piRNA biogenesis protein EXD1-like [Haliotis rubra]